MRPLRRSRRRFGLVGATAAVRVPAGATTVDLAGLTVMPAIADTHTHLSRDRAGLTADLKHRAYFGVSAAMSLGQDNGDDIYAMRREVIPGHALYRTAGRGFTAPEPGRSDVPYWITTADEGRAGVREQAALGVDIIKVWVDDRMGQYPKLAPELYGAVIEEAHANGLRTTAHEYYLADAKELVRRGIDALRTPCASRSTTSSSPCSRSDRLRSRPQFAGSRRRAGHELALFELGQRAGRATSSRRRRSSRAQAFFAIQARNLERLSAKASRSRSAPTATCRRGRISNGRYGRNGHDACASHRRFDEHCCGVHAAHRRRHRCAGARALLCSTRSPRRHHEHAAYSRRLLAR